MRFMLFGGIRREGFRLSAILVFLVLYESEVVGEDLWMRSAVLVGVFLRKILQSCRSRCI